MVKTDAAGLLISDKGGLGLEVPKIYRQNKPCIMPCSLFWRRISRICGQEAGSGLF
jgi:hypothetical protein